MCRFLGLIFFEHRLIRRCLRIGLYELIRVCVHALPSRVLRSLAGEHGLLDRGGGAGSSLGASENNDSPRRRGLDDSTWADSATHRPKGLEPEAETQTDTN